MEEEIVANNLKEVLLQRVHLTPTTVYLEGRRKSGRKKKEVTIFLEKERTTSLKNSVKTVSSN